VLLRHTTEQRLTPQVVNEVISRCPSWPPAGSSRTRWQKRSTINPNKKKVLFVTSELADLVKTGGLGDVSAALPRAMRHLHDVRVLIPGYPQVLNSDNPIHIIGELGGHAALPPCKIGRMDLKDGLVIYVLICPELYEREGTPYGANNGRDWPDNHIRFARLGLAAADIAANLAQIHWQPDLVHAHDWPAGLAPAYMHWRGQRTPTLFTIHNLAYQGVVSLACCPELGIPSPRPATGRHGVLRQVVVSQGRDGLFQPYHHGQRHLRQEITTPAFGCGLDGFLPARPSKACSAASPMASMKAGKPPPTRIWWHPFAIGDWQGKAINAAHVRNLFGLAPSKGPLFAVVSRLVYQKGLDLTEAVAAFIVANGGQICIIGRGEPEEEQAMRELALRFPGQIGVRIGFNETDARRMFAGSDFLLMPSRYEPCGLSQMYAQRLARCRWRATPAAGRHHRRWRDRLSVRRIHRRQLRSRH
jgi:starch synthase